jgi:hypothetical protein
LEEVSVSDFLREVIWTMTRKVLKQVGHWACAGVLPVQEMRRVLLQVIAFVGMTPAPYDPVIWWYPTPDGAGGQGYTLVQPLTESFITADIYEKDLEGNPKNQTEIILASCRDYDPVAVGMLLRKLVGPSIEG